MVVTAKMRSHWWMRFSRTMSAFEALGPTGASLLFVGGGVIMVALGLYLILSTHP